MLEVVKRKQDLVEKTYRRGGSLFLETQKGLLRLKPRNDSIVRISYTQKGEFTGNVGIGILEEKEWDDWICEEQECRVVLYTEKLALEVDKDGQYPLSGKEREAASGGAGREQQGAGGI